MLSYYALILCLFTTQRFGSISSFRSLFENYLASRIIKALPGLVGQTILSLSLSLVSGLSIKLELQNFGRLIDLGYSLSDDGKEIKRA